MLVQTEALVVVSVTRKQHFRSS